MNWKVIELPKEKYPIKAEFEMKPIGVTIHETDNNASATNEIAYMQRNDNKVSFHFAVDEKEIIQGLPLDRNAWHCGDGRNGKGNRQTIAIEICRNYRTDDLTNYYKARENAEKLVGYLLKKYGWTDKDIYTHNYWNGKNCPRVILEENYLDTFKKNAMAHAGKKEPSKPTVKPKMTAKEMAYHILYESHNYGNGQERKDRLTKDGYNPTEVQKEINAMLVDQTTVTKPKPAPKPSKPQLKSIETIAKEVLNGSWGNGADRKNRLTKAGYDFDVVQAEVNRQLGLSTVQVNRKSVTTIAKEVINGKWGNNPKRKNALIKAGYDYNAVQAEVNRLLK